MKHKWNEIRIEVLKEGTYRAYLYDKNKKMIDMAEYDAETDSIRETLSYLIGMLLAGWEK